MYKRENGCGTIQRQQRLMNVRPRIISLVPNLVLRPCHTCKKESGNFSMNQYEGKQGPAKYSMLLLHEGGHHPNSHL
jgi:hypothetical protein